MANLLTLFKGLTCHFLWHHCILPNILLHGATIKDFLRLCYILPIRWNCLNCFTGHFSSFSAFKIVHNSTQKNYTIFTKLQMVNFNKTSSSIGGQVILQFMGVCNCSFIKYYIHLNINLIMKKTTTTERDGTLSLQILSGHRF